jgi:hypothetical protein
LEKIAENCDHNIDPKPGIAAWLSGHRIRLKRRRRVRMALIFFLFCIVFFYPSMKLKLFKCSFPQYDEVYDAMEADKSEKSAAAAISKKNQVSFLLKES